MINKTYYLIYWIENKASSHDFVCFIYYSRTSLALNLPHHLQKSHIRTIFVEISSISSNLHDYTKLHIPANQVTLKPVFRNGAARWIALQAIACIFVFQFSRFRQILTFYFCLIYFFLQLNSSTQLKDHPF